MSLSHSATILVQDRNSVDVMKTLQFLSFIVLFTCTLESFVADVHACSVATSGTILQLPSSY